MCPAFAHRAVSGTPGTSVNLEWVAVILRSPDILGVLSFCPKHTGLWVGLRVGLSPLPSLSQGASCGPAHLGDPPVAPRTMVTESLLPWPEALSALLSVALSGFHSPFCLSCLHISDVTCVPSWFKVSSHSQRRLLLSI